MGDEDYLLALELQKEFDKELTATDFEVKPIEERHYQKRRRSDDDEDLNSTQNLVHPQWETLDPTPDVYALFRAFDEKFFQCRLRCVALEWSKRMYSCAGICYTRRNRLGMAITIRLSEPLLKLRPRKNLIETLLHEMIHAYCSVLGIREGNGGHGPNFRKIMDGINKVAGTNITVYHTFHDEVDIYKTHWWRCNGICQNRKPFFGYVKRTSNRAPGPNDIWWKQHLESCGGTFLKIKEPKKDRPTTSKKEKIAKPNSDLRKHFPVVSKGSSSPPFKGGIKTNGGGTLLLNPTRNKTVSTTSDLPKNSEPNKAKNNFGNLTNVIGFKDLGTSGISVSPQHSTQSSLSGIGYSLTGSKPYEIKLTGDTANRKVDKNKLRDIWANKFAKPSEESSIQSETANAEVIEIGSDAKRRRVTTNLEDNEVITIGGEVNQWQTVDDDIMIKEDVNTIIDISSEEDDDNSPIWRPVEVKPDIKPKIAQTADERLKQIKQEIINSSDHDITEDDIDIIDDEYDDDLVNTSAELADTSLLDDLFGEDTLLREFKKENAVIASNSRYHSDPRNDIITCPVCQSKVTREQFSEHIDGCVGITVRINPTPSSSKGKIFTSHENKKKIGKDKIAETLKNAGYDPSEFEDELSFSNSDDEDRSRRRNGLDTSTHSCPVCGREVDVDRINEHLDVCLK